MITIGLVQSDIQHTVPERNFGHYETLLREQMSAPVQLLVLPEMFACGFGPDLRAYAEHGDGPSVIFLQHLAQEYHCDVVASLPVEEGGNIYNRLFWMSPEGVRATYDKHNLFFGEEREQCTPGTERTVVEAFGYKFLPLICFDVRFPEWSRNHRTGECYDYDCLLYTANFPAPREKVLQKLAAARAIENQAYVAGVNRGGRGGKGHIHRGGTAVFDPDGRVLAAAEHDREQIVTATLPLHSLATIREWFPVLG